MVVDWVACIYTFSHTFSTKRAKKNYNKNHTIFNSVSNSNRGSSFNIKHHHIRQHYTARSTSEATNDERETDTQHTANEYKALLLSLYIYIRQSACALTPLTFLICDDRFSFNSNSVGIRCVLTVFRGFSVFRFKLCVFFFRTDLRRIQIASIISVDLLNFLFFVRFGEEGLAWFVYEFLFLETTYLNVSR